MSKNEISESLLNHYIEPQKKKPKSLKRLHVSKKAGQTLNDFYTEVQTKKNNSVMENAFLGKNATQIETIMIQNRKLIEAKYTKR